MKSSAIKSLLLTLAAVVAMLATPQRANAFSVDSYATESVLASGRWIKVSVATTGMHFISNSMLASWGFTHPEKVSVHGYGGRRLPDKLSRAAYFDDLPAVQIHRTDKGIYFYAVGPASWVDVNTTNSYQALNPFSNFGYYFLTDSSDESDREIPTEGFESVTSTPVTTFTEKIYHEVDEVSPGQTGHLLVGEDFRYTRSRTFNFDLTGREEGTGVWIRSSFVAAVSARSAVTYTVNGTALDRSTYLSAMNNYIHGTRATLSMNVDNVNGQKLALGVNFEPQGVVTLANLDAITINYTRALALHNGLLHFTVSRPSVQLAGAGAETVVWDVTDPLNISRIRTVAGSGSMQWTNTYSGVRTYAAFNPGGVSVPSPAYVGAVANQNLHAPQADLPDMVIFTVRDWAGEANRLANFHRSGPDKLNVVVVNQDDVFNEFSSGVPDVYAFRHYLKMVYDRGKEAGHPLKYVLMFGRSTFDNRQLTAEMKTLREPYMPTWQTDDGLSLTDSFTSDDPITMLDDDSGVNLAMSNLSVAIGRAPIHNLTNAKTFVDKVIAYANNSYNTDWKNQVVMMADNGDLGVFMKDSERQYANFTSSASGSNMFYTKVYIDAFNIIGGQCTGGRQRLHRMLDEGILWWNYIGHGAISTLAEENVMTNTDINNMYNRRWPVLFAATCSFGMHDGLSICGSETMLLTPNAGVIAAIAPTRESLITHNGTIAAAFGDQAFQRDEQGRFMTIGEICRRSKQQMLSSASRDANNQKLYYTLLGDPALRLATPSPTVALEQIDDEEVNDENQCTIMARQRVRLRGAVYNTDGTLMDDFNGTISLALYDAEYSTTSQGASTGGSKPTQGEQITFEEQGAKLYVGRDSVSGGRFDVQIAMPAEVADNFRPAALNMYALASDGREAIGCNRQFYVYGYDDTAEPDSNPPTINTAFLNHESFAQGSVVNESPMFIADISDDIGINLSTAGIGHQMTLKLDDSRSFTDVAFYYTPSPDGSPSGSVAYPMENLSEGNHTLTFRVWDTSGNSASRTLSFFVEQGATPKIFDIFTDVNPASTEANFYLSHNRPDSRLTVTLDIYDMLGHRVWTTTVTDRSDMFLSAPIHWDLTDMAGRRVQRGIYIYRATVTTDGANIQSAAKRIAVTGH
ncbi:MAG: type IX secretion system sortase PorU [Firmicutes bacterium]|nr:type IX secretion system sortase PorU [Bacillota bacterium]MCM1401044.1 type IX secretion system sortase PorU [Bacteroides sp.]MCM1476963.1 type IX secretion system sortase PorU [Bacteroides sp.]